MNIILKFAAATGLAAALVTPALAEDEEDWDTDGDGSYTESEFEDGWKKKGHFADYDENADGMIDEDEFNRASFKRYDRDGSDDIDSEERASLDRDLGEMEREED